MKRDLSKQYNCDLSMYEFPIIKDARGNLTYIEGGGHIPFDIKRVYYLYDVPGGAERGGHAHRGLHQVIIAMSGSFDVLLHDGVHESRVHLNRSYKGLYIGPMTWRELDNFSSGSVCLVLASEVFEEGDYIRDYATFVREKFASTLIDSYNVDS
jgi:hypothetical protein